MGKNKKVITSQVQSLKSSKNNGTNNSHDQKKKKKSDFSSLINVLRPKVYITDSSSFKRLVQELTGNESTTSICPKIDSPVKVPIIDIDVEFQGDPESSFEATIDEVSTDSSSEFFFNKVVSLDQEFNQVFYNNETGLEVELGNSEPSQHDDLDLLAYWDIESWLLHSSSPYGCHGNGCDQFQQDVSIYDYELSGML